MVFMIVLGLLVYTTIQSLLNNDMSSAKAAIVWGIGLGITTFTLFAIRDQWDTSRVLFACSLIALAMLPYFSTAEGLVRTVNKQVLPRWHLASGESKKPNALPLICRGREFNSPEFLECRRISNNDIPSRDILGDNGASRHDCSFANHDPRPNKSSCAYPCPVFYADRSMC
jgi:hypothetical protein